MDEDGPRLDGDREFAPRERTVALSPVGDAGEADGGGRRIGRRELVAAAALLALLGALAYDHRIAGTYPVPGVEWDPTAADWLFLCSLPAAGYLLAAVAGSRRLAGRYWRRLRGHPGGIAGLGFLCGLFAAGLAGPAVLGVPEFDPLYAFQPPAWSSVPAEAVTECAGRVADGRCHGSLRFPLGTDEFGQGVATGLASGARVAVYVVVVTTALVVPLGALVGAVAGYYGGLPDALFMGYVDVQTTVPAVVIYVVLIVVVGKSLFLLLLVFGLFSWGGVARIVRAAARQRRTAGYVVAGRSVGGSDAYLLRRHLLPNVSHAVVTVLAGQIPLLLITETALAYLELSDADAVSWGTLIAGGLSLDHWWVSVFPVAALAGTVLAVRLLGDALRDVLDPRD